MAHRRVIELPYTPHPGQRLVHASKARFRVLCCGRRWGKTVAAIWECFDKAISKPNSLVWYIGPTYVQSKPVWRLAKQKYPQQYIKSIKEVLKEIHLTNGSIIEFKSADNPDDLRSVGENLALVVFDECAFLPSSIWTIMRPALIDNQTPALFISTPKGRNWFYQLWLKGQKTINGQENQLYSPDWESWKFSSYDNPYIKKEEIDALIKDGGLSSLEIAREIYADFVEASGAVLPLDAIESCIVQVPEDLPPSPDEQYVMGLDIARVTNYTVAIVMNSQRTVVAHRSMQGPWTAQAKAIRSLWERYNKPMVIFDSTGVGDAFRPLLVNEGITPLRGIDFRKYKTQLVENLKVAIEERMVFFPNIPQLIKELQHFEAKETPSGKIDYSAPHGQHDDYVFALALAYWGLTKTANTPTRRMVHIIGRRPLPYPVAVPFG